MTLSRRSFFAGLAAAIAAPAVVKAESLMPVKVWRPDVWRVYGVSPGVASLADMLDFDRAAQRYAETLSAPNELLNCLTFERAEDAFAVADRQALHDLVAFGQGGSVVDRDAREIRLVHSAQRFNAALECCGDRPVERNYRIQTRFDEREFERSHFVKRPSWWFG